MTDKTFVFAKTLKESLDTAEYTDNTPVSFGLDQMIGSQFVVHEWQNVKALDKTEIVSKAAAYGYDVLD